MKYEQLAQYKDVLKNRYEQLVHMYRLLNSNNILKADI